VPFIVGVDRYLPPAFGKIHPKWRTPYVSILVQAGISLAVLLLSNINETTSGAYQILVDAATIFVLRSVPLYVCGGYQTGGERGPSTECACVLIPGGKIGVWIAGGLGVSGDLGGIVLSFVPPGETTNKYVFSAKLIGGTVVAIGFGLFLLSRGAAEERGVF